MNSLRSLPLLLVTIFSAPVFAHGGGGPEPKEEPKKVVTISASRHAPLKPDVLAPDVIEKLMGEKEIAKDVAGVRCALSEFTTCRGVDIVLHDLRGNEILRAHTGTTGMVGFEGLKANTNYIARIESDRYAGEAQIRAGGVYEITGQRK